MMTVEFQTRDDATNWAIDWLREHGYGITVPLTEGPLTPGELWQTHAPHLSRPEFQNRITNHRCPPFSATRGPSGRILTIKPNAPLLEWLRATKPCS